MQKIQHISILSVFLLLATILVVQSAPVQINDTIPLYPCIANTTLYQDPTDTAQLAFAQKQQFSAELPTILKFGFATNAYWLKMPLQNNSDKPVALTYTLANRYLNTVEFYGVKNGETLFSYVYKDGLPEPQNQEFLLNGIAFNFDIPAQSEITVFIRIFNDGDIITFTPSLYTRNSFETKKEIFLTVSGCFFGIMLLIWLFSLFYFRLSKEAYYRYYSFYIISVLLFTAHLHGLLQMAFPSVSESTFDLIFSMTLYFNIFSFFGFLQSFFGTKQYLPVLHKASRVLVLYLLPIVFLVLINKKDLTFNISTIVSSILIFAIIFGSFFRKRYASLFLIVSIAISIIAIIASRYGSPLEDNFFSSNLFSIVFLMNLASIFGSIMKSHTDSMRDTEKQLKQRQYKIAEHNQIILDKNKELETAMQAVLKAEAEQAELQQQLVESNKMETMGRLAGGIAHDFNNILTPIVGHADLAIETTTDEETKEDLQVILKSALRAKELINQILTFSRKYTPEAYPVDVFKIIQDAMELLNASFPKNISIEYSLSSTKLFVLANNVQLQQILLNLCTNAKDAIGSKSGLIKIRQEFVHLKNGQLDLPEDNYGKITISDNGSGMPEEVRKNIFFPFYTTKPKGSGTGLGLSVAHGIITSFGGAITVDSSEGRGTDFSVYLPATEEISDVPAEQLEEQYHTAERKVILVVDDEESIRTMLEQKLSRIGHTVITKENGKLAYDFLQARKVCVDLVITDQMMPEMTGEELIKKIRSNCTETKIILISGFSEKLSANIDLGANEVVMKPFSLDELTKKINNLFAKNE